MSTFELSQTRTEASASSPNNLSPIKSYLIFNILLLLSQSVNQNQILLLDIQSTSFISLKYNIANVMMMKRVIFLLLSIVQLTVAFAPIINSNFAVRSSCLFAGENESEGGAAIAKPQVKTNQKVETVQKSKQEQKKKERVYDPISRRDEEFMEAPMYKLMLLGDESYDAVHVMERMCAIVDDMDEDQATTVIQQAKSSGEAMCGKYPFEKAELFKEQLIRSDPMIYSEIKEENK